VLGDDAEAGTVGDGGWDTTVVWKARWLIVACIVVGEIKCAGQARKDVEPEGMCTVTSK
jgi:hypothetical protein